jgi:uncharacterized protein YndB with AHSA1/START domain
MIATKETIYSKDASNKKLKVEREFDAPVAQVWKAWTEPELLDQWWAPKPWKANTKSMDFREGGRWFYYMEGPDGTRHYCMFNYQAITDKKSITGFDAFCDEHGNVTNELPSMSWTTEFSAIASGTRVNVQITFSSEADMDKLIEMGFKEGFTSALGNLDELLAA